LHLINANTQSVKWGSPELWAYTICRHLWILSETLSNTLAVFVRGTKSTWAFLWTKTTTFLEHLILTLNTMRNCGFSLKISSKITLNKYCKLSLTKTKDAKRLHLWNRHFKTNWRQFTNYYRGKFISNITYNKLDYLIFPLVYESLTCN